MGAQAEHVFDSLSFAADSDRDKYDTVLAKLDEHFVPKRNIIFERAQFYQRNQKDGETVESFVRSLYELSQFCEFEEKRDDFIRDKLVIGLRDRTLSEKLQMTASLTLTLAVNMARHHELIKQQNVGPSIAAVSKPGRGRYETARQRDFQQRRRQRDSQSRAQQPAPNKLCKYCGYDMDKAHNARGNRKECPAKRAQCRFCGKIGHFEKVCHKKRVHGVTVEDTDPISSGAGAFANDNLFLGAVNLGDEPRRPMKKSPAMNRKNSRYSRENSEFMNHVEKTRRKISAMNSRIKSGVGSHVHSRRGQSNRTRRNLKTFRRVYRWGKKYISAANHILRGRKPDMDNVPPWTVDVDLNGTNITFKIDSGADVNVISKTAYDGLRKRPVLHASKARLDSVTGPIVNIGMFNAKLRHRKSEYMTDIHVVDHPTDNLMSRSLAVKMSLITRIDSIKDACNGSGRVKLRNPVDIKLRADIEPYSIKTPRRIAIPLMPKVETELKRMESRDIIVKVEEPTDWCSPIVPIPKSSGDVRICVDLKRLNAAVRRERYILPTAADLFHQLRGSTVFSTLDAESGYWQFPLTEAASKLTTFITPFGRYRFKRLPFGISSASEIFQREMMTLLDGLDGVIVYQDDVLVHGTTVKQHDDRLDAVLNRIIASGLRLNENKCKIRQNSLAFLGHIIDKDGCRPDPDKVTAIADISRPTNITEIRQFSGMINFLSKYVPNLSAMMVPINDLLKKDREWTWDAAQDDAFQRVKEAIASPTVLAYYDPNRATIVQSDASSYGLGGVILQDHDGKLRAVAYASRSLTEAETRYAQIEKELLAAVWASEKFDKYLRGLDSFKIHTDHKPLIPIINSKDIDTAPIRCQRLLLRLMKYNATAEFVPGKLLTVADALSRKPVGPGISTTDNDVEAYVCGIREMLPISDRRLAEVRTATEEDQDLQLVMRYTLTGWPRRTEDVLPSARSYHHIRNELSVADGLLLRGARIVIPVAMRTDILDKIHHGHQGVTKSRERANQSVWWPGLSHEIADLVAGCEHCLTYRNSQRHEPLIPSILPERPWQHIGMDFLTFQSKDYLVMMDYYSRYVELSHMPSTTSRATVEKSKNIFARWGVPERITSDNGPQFSGGVFEEFAEKYKIELTPSSPGFPQSNGQAESGVQIAKRILRNPDPSLALMVYRATPVTATGFSPSELMIGRKIRTTLPMISRQLTPKTVNFKAIEERDAVIKDRYTRDYNRRHGVRELSPLRPGDTVRMKYDGEKTLRKEGTILESREFPRSFTVDTGDGVYRRNRKHLVRVPEVQPSSRGAKVPDVPQDQKHRHLVRVPEVPEDFSTMIPAAERRIPDDPGGRSPVKSLPRSSGRETRMPTKFRDFVM